MANDPQHPDDVFGTPRQGASAEYNSLTTYYVGLGGNGNTEMRVGGLVVAVEPAIDDKAEI